MTDSVFLAGVGRLSEDEAVRLSERLPAPRRWALLAPGVRAAGTLAVTVWAAGGPSAWFASASEALAMSGFVAWNVAPYAGMAGAMLVLWLALGVVVFMAAVARSIRVNPRLPGDGSSPRPPRRIN